EIRSSLTRAPRRVLIHLQHVVPINAGALRPVPFRSRASSVYTVRASGGVPKRLTCHPGADVAAGWTNDGKRALFSSSGGTRCAFFLSSCGASTTTPADI